MVFCKVWKTAIPIALHLKAIAGKKSVSNIFMSNPILIFLVYRFFLQVNHFLAPKITHQKRAFSRFSQIDHQKSKPKIACKAFFLRSKRFRILLNLIWLVLAAFWERVVAFSLDFPEFARFQIWTPWAMHFLFCFFADEWNGAENKLEI